MTHGTALRELTVDGYVSKAAAELSANLLKDWVMPEEKKPAPKPRHVHVFVVSGDGRFEVCTCGETRERVERWS